MRAQSGKDIYIANYLTEQSLALSGAKEACDLAREIAMAEGAKSAAALQVAGAFHTRYMASAEGPLREALEKVSIHSPKIAVFANVDGSLHTSPNRIKDLLVRQVSSPVRWSTIMQTVLGHPSFNKKCYELGPGNTCKSIVKMTNRRVDVVSVSA